MIDNVTLKTLDPALLEALCLHEAFRRLGFPPEDLWLGSDVTGAVVVELRTQGKSFVAYAGHTSSTASEEMFGRLWEKAISLIVEGTDEEIIEAWNASNVGKHFLDFALSIHDKGISLPILAPKILN